MGWGRNGFGYDVRRWFLDLYSYDTLTCLTCSVSKRRYEKFNQLVHFPRKLLALLVTVQNDRASGAFPELLPL